jgi:type IV pilus assembly protein PilO
VALQTGLEGKPWYVGVIAGVLFGGVLFFLLHARILEPMKEEIQRKDGQLQELQTKIQQGRAAKQQLPQFRDEVRRLELELDKLLRILPSRRNTPQLIRRVRELTEQHDFELIRFTPHGLVDRDFYSEWPISIHLEATYHNLALFFDRIGRFSRIINIENLTLSGLARPSHSLSATFSAKTFVYKETEAAQGPAPGGG